MSCSSRAIAAVSLRPIVALPEPAAFAVVERLVVEGDDYVRNLGVIGFLEGLQMMTVTAAGIDPEEAFRPLVGPVSERWWERINRFWGGEHDALQVEHP